MSVHVQPGAESPLSSGTIDDDTVQVARAMRGIPTCLVVMSGFVRAGFPATEVSRDASGRLFEELSPPV